MRAGQTLVQVSDASPLSWAQVLPSSPESPELSFSLVTSIAAFTVFIGAELSFYFFGNSKSAELAENMASNLLLIQLPLYLLIKNALGLRFVTRQVCFVDEKRARRHLVGMALFSLLYWLTVLTTTVLLRERLPYPANTFLAAGIVFLLAPMMVRQYGMNGAVWSSIISLGTLDAMLGAIMIRVTQNQTMQSEKKQGAVLHAENLPLCLFSS